MGTKNDLEKFQIKHLALCKRLGLKGKVLIAEEGINGSLTGTEKEIKEYKKELCKDKRFSDMQFKEGSTKHHNFKRMFVRIKPEIVTYKLKVNLKNKADYIEPEQLKKLLDKKEDIVILDVRNKFEYNIGHFNKSVQLNMDKSTELPKAVKKLNHLKNKIVVTCCTGGVRCEKASAYLKEHGFKNVRQLHGGIVRYGEKIGSKHWGGRCFVFDTRGAIDLNPKKQAKPISQCELCNIPNDDYHNCANVNCDRRVILCDKCFDTLNYCCSKTCRNQVKIHPKWYNSRANLWLEQ